MTQENGTQYLISGIHYATGRPVNIYINRGVISSISEAEGNDEIEGNFFIAPGLIDNQINGYAGIDFSGNELTPEGVVDAVNAIWKDGVTTFLPTLITAGHESLVNNFGILNKALSLDKRVAGSVHGFHLEGPYISPDEGYRGCHPVQYIRKPSWDEFSEYQKACGGKIKQVTLAPEIEGADEFIANCSANGVLTAMGHTAASAEIIAGAVSGGVKLSTHLGNGCANYIHRHYNPIWPQLANERLTATIIADGHHLLPEELKVFYKVKGPDNLILTSDVVYLSGMAPGRYIFLESEVLLTEEGMLKNISLNCLAGASFPLKTGVGNMMKFTGCSLEDAINMASGNVARIYGMEDRGTLVPGKRADLILFEMEGDQMKIKKTWVNGELVHNDQLLADK